MKKKILAFGLACLACGITAAFSACEVDIGSLFRVEKPESSSMDWGYIPPSSSWDNVSSIGGVVGYSSSVWGEDESSSEVEEEYSSMIASSVEEDSSFTGHVHTYSSVQTVSATCTSRGYDLHVCACGDTYRDNYVDALPHTYAEEVTQPTCTQDGYTTFSCRCGENYRGNYVSKLTHSYRVVEQIEATCMEEGRITRICTREDCEYSYVEYTDRADHLYGEEIVQPTCEVDGYIVHSCCNEGCTHQYVENANSLNGLKARGHIRRSWVTVVNEGGNICEDGGQKLYVCDVCKESTNPDCKNCLEMVKDIQYIVPRGHTVASDWVMQTAPTMDEEGSIQGRCSVCEKEDAQVAMPALSTGRYYHETLSVGDCYTKGREYYSINIGTWSGSFEITTTTMHQYKGVDMPLDKIYQKEEVEKVFGNMSHCGLERNGSFTCDLCAEDYLVSVEIPCKAEDLVSVYEPATCYATGREGTECSSCGRGTWTVLPKLEHTYGDFTPIYDDSGSVTSVQVTCQNEGCSYTEKVATATVSEKYLYDESSHWNNVRVETKIIDGAVLGEELKPQNYKSNVAAHNFDSNGRCYDCQYKRSQSEGLAYQLNSSGSGYIVTGRGECKDEHVNIPEIYNGKPVVGIGDNAFSDTTSTGEEKKIIGVTIPDTVVTISCTAFSSLTEMNNFLVGIANQVFTSMDNCLIDKIKGELLRGCEFSVIPEDGSVKIIGSYAFAGCEGLISITVPESIESIKDKAFFECDFLVEVKLPENINLGIDVFRGSIHVEIKIKHDLEFVPALDPTCENPGNVAHYKCIAPSCGHYYEDKLGTVRIYNVEIPASHDFVDGICVKCGKILDTVKIIAVDEIPHLGKFALGTMEDAIGLPKQIYVTTADGNRHLVNVSWELSDYRKDLVGEYTIHGHIIPGRLIFGEGVSAAVETKIEIVDFMKGTADIVFVLDGTGSMGDEIANVKNNIAAFAAALEAKGVSARWSVIDYRDYTENSSEVTHVIKNGAANWFISAADYANAIGKITVSGGGDTPEVAIDGLMLATTLDTRTNARTFYILVTDANHKTANHYGVANMTQLAGILAEKGVNTSVITTSGYYSDYSSLVYATGGITADIYGNFGDDLLEALVPIIQNEVLE